MTPPRDSGDRVVIRAPNWLGDAVLAIPAMAAVREHFRNAHLTIAAPASLAPVFRQLTPASPDAIVELPDPDRAVRAVLQAGQFSTCVLFPNSFRSAWQAKRAAIPERWGYSASGRRWLLTRAARKPARAASRHQSEYYNDLVRGLGLASESSPLPTPTMRPSESSVARADALLRKSGLSPGARFAAIQPGAAYGQAKQWPPDRMAESAWALVQQHDVYCVMLGAAHDRPAARAIESWLRAKAPAAQSRVIDLVGRTSLDALVGVLDRAIVSISNDSGGMHLAAALGRPVVAIFGPTDDRVTSPVGDHDVLVEPVFCRPCMLRDCPIDHRCMKRITVDRVVDAASRRIAAAGVTR